MITYWTANNAQGPLKTAISAASTSALLDTWYGALFPSVFPFEVTIELYDIQLRVLKREQALCTNRVWDLLTLTRAYANCPQSYTAVVQSNIALSFDPNDGAVKISLNVTNNLVQALITEVNAKLDTVGGLNTGYWSNKVKEVDPTTWADVLRTRSTSSSIVNTSLLQFRDASTRNVTETPYSSILADITSSASRLFAWIAGEGFSAYEWGCKEIYSNFVQCSVGWLSFNNDTIGQFGQATARTRKAFRIIWNWTAFSTLKMALNKAWAPVDNVSFRIETDSAWLPSGTLWHANATSTIGWGTLSTGSTDQTITLAWSVTLTAWVVYWIVLARSWGIDAVNYYYVCGLQRNVRAFTMSTHNGTSFQTATTTQDVYVSCTGIYSEVLVKTNATYKETSYHVGYATGAVAVGWALTLNQWGMWSSFGVLTADSTYYLSNTPGAMSTTPGTQVRKIGYTSNGTANLIIYLPENNESLIDQAWTLTYSTIAQIANPLPLLYIVREPTTIVVSGTLSQYWINWTTKSSGTSYAVLPGDIITAFPSSGNVTLTVLNKPQYLGDFLNT